MSTWSRSSLKERAKAALYRSYWKMVLVAFIVTLVSGGASSAGGRAMGTLTDLMISDSGQELSAILPIGGGKHVQAYSDTGFSSGSSTFAWGVIGIALLIIILVVVVASVAFRVFLINPFMVGSAKYFNRGLVEEPPMRELVCGYENHYFNSVKIIFLRDLFVSLWSLLFLIPGIVKSYEYKMVPYIVGECPELSATEVFQKSREMMRGQKWAAFILDLSFLGWWLLTACTCGLVGIFWVTPYYYLTQAALYRQLSGADYSIPVGGYYNSAAGAVPPEYQRQSSYLYSNSYEQRNDMQQNDTQPNGYSQPGTDEQQSNSPSGLYSADYYNVSNTEDQNDSSWQRGTEDQNDPYDM